MSEREHNHNNNVMPGPISPEELNHIREAICLQVEKVYDSCKEKDCLEDLQVHGLPKGLVKKAIDVTCESVEVEDVIIDVEPIRFRPGFFTVSVTFVFKVCVELFFKNQPPQRKCGVAMFTKKVVLFGSKGRVKIFKAKFKKGKPDVQHTPFLEQDNRPNGKVEVAEPVCLGARIEEESTPNLSAGDIAIILSILENSSTITLNNVREQGPGDQNIDIDVNQDINIGNTGNKPERNVVVTIGLFSIIKLVRFVQVLVPSFGFCNPPTCVEIQEAEEACEMFETIEFPLNAFFPPQKGQEAEAGEENEHDHGGCGK